ncbi:hypothetical protein ACFWY6_41350 [Streptomyces sp. NPDC059037]|uniref:hypothetical protein n=1 Tax=Streptomyces sp. NPDC059037 TaxID=3346710 RepID=UPI0036899F2E
MDDGSDAYRLSQAYESALRLAWGRYGQLKDQKFDDSSLQQIAQDAADLTISNLFWRLALGDGCLRSAEYARSANRSPEAVVEDIQNGLLVGLLGRREAWLPLWQFEDLADPSSPSRAAQGLLEVFQATLGEAFSPEVVVLWAATRQPELEDQEPRAVIGWMSLDNLERSAKATAARLAS